MHLDPAILYSPPIVLLLGRDSPPITYPATPEANVFPIFAITPAPKPAIAALTIKRYEAL